MLLCMRISWEWRGVVQNNEINSLHAEGFNHSYTEVDWNGHLNLSLGWVTARDEGELVGFVNVIWDGHTHAFIEDTLVALRVRRQGVGKQLVELATKHAREAGCQWLHVDFEHHLEDFYLNACGFRPTAAGLLQLR